MKKVGVFWETVYIQPWAWMHSINAMLRLDKPTDILLIVTKLQKQLPVQLISTITCRWRFSFAVHGRMKSSVDQIVELACKEHSASLNLSHLDITVVPLKLHMAKDLVSLQLNNNRLIMPPEEIGELDRLQQLSLDHNQLTILPSSLFHLGHLTYLNISYNPLGNWLHCIP